MTSEERQRFLEELLRRYLAEQAAPACTILQFPKKPPPRPAARALREALKQDPK